MVIKTVLSCILVLYITQFNAQINQFQSNGILLKKLAPSVKKFGPYFGLEQGKNLHIEVGGELLYKRIRLKNRILIGSNLGISYGYKPKVVCFDGGIWGKLGRIGFTYGATLGIASDFDLAQFRCSPVVGFKLGPVHFRAGYYLYPGSKTIFERNTFFITARFTLIKHRDFDWK
jgi:hypothetical protein